jgi:hypothetical protein
MKQKLLRAATTTAIIAGLTLEAFDLGAENRKLWRAPNPHNAE